MTFANFAVLCAILPSYSKIDITLPVYCLVSNLGNKSWGLKQLEEGFMLLSSLRSPLCAIVLLTYHTLISYVIGTGDGDLDFAETILDKVKRKLKWDHCIGLLLCLKSHTYISSGV